MFDTLSTSASQTLDRRKHYIGDDAPAGVPAFTAEQLACDRTPDPYALLPWIDDDLATTEEARLPGEGALEIAHGVDTGFSILEGGAGLAESFSEGASEIGDALHPVSPWMTGVGGVLGAVNVGKGVAHFIHAAMNGDVTGTEGSQGVLDVASGGFGIASLVKLAAGGASMPLTIGSGIAGLASAGNRYSEQHGWYGKHRNDKTGKLDNATYLNSIGDVAKTGWRAGHEIAGDNAMGDVLGVIGGGLGAVERTVQNTGAATIAGAIVAEEWASKAWDATHPSLPEGAPHPRGIDALSLAAESVR
jgi:hypothetical protein